MYDMYYIHGLTITICMIKYSSGDHAVYLHMGPSSSKQNQCIVMHTCSKESHNAYIPSLVPLKCDLLNIWSLIKISPRIYINNSTIII